MEVKNERQETRFEKLKVKQSLRIVLLVKYHVVDWRGMEKIITVINVSLRDVKQDEVEV